MSKEKYIVVRKIGAAGDATEILVMTKEQIDDMAKKSHYTDFAVIEGTIIKPFNKNHWPPKGST